MHLQFLGYVTLLLLIVKKIDFILTETFSHKVNGVFFLLKIHKLSLVDPMTCLNMCYIKLIIYLNFFKTAS